MTIRQSDLTNAAYGRTQRSFSAKRYGQPSAFLSHSHKDERLALGLQQMLVAQGWDIYIDWQDQQMPDQPDVETAKRIKRAIIGADWFLFLATENSTASRWCPWEIGYADGEKPLNRIAVVPTTDANGSFYGNEYLRLYSRIDTANSGGLALFDTKNQGTWVRSL
ncbi:TIR domain-containing protein [Pseudomonas koreensis]|uniref:toll/interleukin-1 receptor domain-containing protein n=1 Tax=Pseudomonas koreensis TaxID=198620 RepID=UPI00087983F8|nr:toll/interleukin-1 receptor domain-containing protein [Pseudomonas koreensis]KAB0514158.1 toll/interleukin-1 receptor domain-containing protein [Pseudomonas koreensis]NNA62634.1 toll/interleukin-1 receptor domain-containing protein [Pseudomonas koreensis]GGK48318.1 hypothetical protein GCM10009103_48510 [Pseudomonas koreensis]SDC59524.1 TIR domain-containing protein [Pseudomonas koreensis]